MKPMRLMCGLVAAAVLAVNVATTALGGTIRDDRSDQLYLDLAAQSKYNSVGLIQISTLTGNYLGSGTLISDQWVLTAGHMVYDATSLSFTVGGSTYTSSQWMAYSKYNGDLLAGYDIGLAKLDSAVVGINPAERYTGSDELGMVGTMVGYGMTGTGLTGAVDFDWQKRAGQNVLDVLYKKGGKPKDAPRILLSDFDNPNDAGDNAYGSATPLDLEYSPAPGDSGGGVFIEVGGLTLLAGVHSFGASYDGDTNSDYGDVMGNIRVSEFNAWIDDILAGNTDSGGKGNKGGNGGNNGGGPKNRELGPIVSNAVIPEPGTLALLAFGAGVAGLLRRRRA